MKLLWVKTDFLHPTTRGGQIRTLEMVKRLHRRHEVHYGLLRIPTIRKGWRGPASMPVFITPCPIGFPRNVLWPLPSGFFKDSGMSFPWPLWDTGPD